MALILRVGVLLLPLKLVIDVDTDIPLKADYDKQESAEPCPSNKPAIVPQVKVVVGHCAAFAQREHEPPENVEDFENVDAVLYFLEGGLVVVPIDFAHDVQDVDRYPDEEVPDRGQYDKLFKEQVIERQQ